MSCEIKLKHPLINALANLGSKTLCTIRVSLKTYEHATYGDTIAGGVFVVKLKKTDPAKCVTPIKGYPMQSDVKFVVTTSEDVFAWVDISLEAAFGFSASGKGSLPPILTSGYLGQLKSRKKNVIDLSCVLYRTDDDINTSMWSMYSRRPINRYHMDTTASLLRSENSALFNVAMFNLNIGKDLNG